MAKAKTQTTRTTRKISRDTIAAAKKVRDALDAALKVAESGVIDLDGELPALPKIELKIDPAVRPSQDVAEAAAQSKAARERLARQTSTARSVSLILGVAAEVGRVLLPNIGALLRLVVLLAIGLAGLGGCVAPEAVQAEGHVDVAAQAHLASPEAHVGSENVVTTSQPASADTGTTTGGRDVKIIQVSPTLSGSAWPIVAVVALLVAGAAIVVWARTHRQCDRKVVLAAFEQERTVGEYTRLRDNAVGVAKAIAKLRPGPERDAVLSTIQHYLPNQVEWDRLLDQYGLRVHRSDKDPAA